MSYPYRCSIKRTCGARKVLPKPIEMYTETRRPKCPACKRNTLKPDKWRKETDKKRTCLCDGYPHPHHRGTEPWCQHAKIGPVDSDYQGRYKQ
jgi:hypothetical protein